MRSRETEFCVCERERYFTTRVITRETYEGTQDISRERGCVEDITTECKPPRRGRFTFTYAGAQGNPEDGTLWIRLRGPEPAGDLGPMVVNRHDCINLYYKIGKRRPRRTLVCDSLGTL